MSTQLRIDELAARFFDGVLTDGEAAELQRLICSDAAAGDRFAELARLEADLVERFRVARESEKAARAIQAIHAERERWRYRWFAAGAAAVLLLSVGSFWYVASQKPGDAAHSKENGAKKNEGGAVVASAGERRKANTGETFNGSDTREIELPDGSLATLEKEARIVVQAPVEGERVALEQTEGKAAFKVVKGEAAFVVRTSVGEVKVLGTEFSVELRTGEDETGAEQELRSTSGNEKKGAEKMRISTIMLVAVATGLVEVNVGGVSYNLLGGQSRAFAEEKKGGDGTEVAKKGQKGDGQRKVFGTISNPGAESVTLTTDGKGGPQSEIIKITANTQILIETNEDVVTEKAGKESKHPQQVEGTAASLVTGETAVALVNDNGEALRIIQQRHRQPKGDGQKGFNQGDVPNPKKIKGEGDAGNPPKVKGDGTGDAPTPKKFKGEGDAGTPPKLKGDGTGDAPTPKKFKGNPDAGNPPKVKGDGTGDAPTPKKIKGDPDAGNPPKVKGDGTGDTPTPKKFKGDPDAGNPPKVKGDGNNGQNLKKEVPKDDGDKLF